MMKASAFEFRFRFLIYAVVYVLGFTAPWNRWLHLDTPDTLRAWRVLVALLVKPGLSFGSATLLVLALGIVFALAGALLRTWGTAYLSPGVVQDPAMHGERIVAAGPYRYVRNPLYLGTFLHTLALGLLMPPSGAAFSLVAVGLLELRLIGGEEAFLGAKLGEAYREYCVRVPRILPALKARVAGSAARPAWGMAVLGEIYMWGVVAAFVVFIVAAAAYGRYDTFLIVQGVVVALGVSLVARAFVPKASAAE